jgi:hypothetical protein
MNVLLVPSVMLVRLSRPRQLSRIRLPDASLPYGPLTGTIAPLDWSYSASVPKLAA